MKKRSFKRLLAMMLSGLMLVTSTGIDAGTAFAAEGRKIDVWDLGGVQEADTTLYNNNIKAEDWNAEANVGNDGKFLTTGSKSFGDLTITFNSNDRLYSGLASKNYGSSAYATTAHEDGYTANGMYYCNGTGGATRRYFTIDNVQAGDKIVVYMGAHNASEDDLVFEYVGTEGSQKDLQKFAQGFTKHIFIAQYSGSYKIWTNAVAKAGYNRIVRIPGAEVSGTVDNGGVDISAATLSFLNEETGVETVAEMKDGKFSVSLAPGYEYQAVLSGMVGYGFTNASKMLKVEDSDIVKGISGIKLVVETKSIYDFTGSIKGFAKDYDISKLAITLCAPEDTTYTDVKVAIASDLSFKASLEPDVEYTMVLSGVNDYEIVSDITIKDNQALNKDIEVAMKKLYEVKGGYLKGEASKITAIEFVNVEDGYTYKGAVSANGFTAKLRDGAYSVNVTSDTYKTSTHIVVNGSDVEKDLMMTLINPVTESIARVDKIYVGYEDKTPNYDTIQEAVAAAAAMNPTKEEERISIYIAPGTYREQIRINTPYLSFINESDEEVLITWYYGIGYKYYSADEKGFYSEEKAHDKYDKHTVANWGFAVQVNASATAFRAENIVFENSFNRYITDEEIEDGVQIDAKNFERKYGADVTSKAATERAAALYIKAPQSEFINCTFLSSQDTLYTDAAGIYFKNCIIEGNTDFIFGDGNVVFEACEISLYGYSTGSVAGYLTAIKDTGSNGYLFRNCVVTEGELNVTPGFAFGRPWGAKAKVLFENTKLSKLSLISAAGWTSMSGAQPENANFGEYNTTDLTGKAATVTGRTKGTVKTEAIAFDYKNFLGFVPKYSVATESKVAFATAPYVVSNGDLNTPYPGNTFTVGYSLGEANDNNDCSIIEWYRVKDGAETLVKISSAIVSDSYKLTSEDIGAKIKVVVRPENVDGTTGTKAEFVVAETVRDGYEDPSASKAEAALGDGINVYLAGDSTVKDYSAAGMYMNGDIRGEGSWGEYLQEFLNEDLVTVVNYANGGRSTRNFINEGTLDKIKANIKEGDYLLIQFGHNDCSNDTGHVEDRYVPLGQPDANGIYPVTAGKEVATPSSLQSKYGDTFYSYDCGGTFKWYLLQYIEAARSVGATPILVTPVARLYFDSDGMIKAAHDATKGTAGTQNTTGNAYVTAMKQLAEEQNVTIIDATQLTTDLYQAAYKADKSASGSTSPLAKQVFFAGDSTHSNKLGGFVSAAVMAQQILDLDCSLSYAVQSPAQVLGELKSGQSEFVVNANGVLTAYTTDAEGNYTVKADYWAGIGQQMIDEIALAAAKKSGEYNKSTMWVIGDSTVCGFTDNYYYPRYGYGTQLSEYFDTNKFEVQNLALSGRSSLSFLSEANYKTLIDGMQEGDVLVIGFGHNDEKAEAARYTNPNGSYTDKGSFAYNLYENYVKIAKEKGVTVILCTPIVRRTGTGEWSNSQLHITATIDGFAGGDYSEAIRKLGKDTNTAVVDMTTLTKELYDKLGAAETLNLHAWLSSKETSVDNTHTNIWGAKYNAYMFATAVKALKINGVSEHVKNVAAAPDKAATLISNPAYVEPTYTPGDLAQSELWKDYGIFKGTVFGDVGGTPNTDNQLLETDANGNMHIAVMNNKGKISSTTDGIAMYYFKIPSDATFTLSADMTINAFNANNQVSFGLTVRDAMYIDYNSKDSTGDNVNAGFLRVADMASAYNGFARKDGALVSGGTLTKSYKEGDTVKLTLSGTADGYATTIGEEATVSGGFDFKLTSLDPDNVYIGMYAARNADVTFSNISLIVNGKEVDIMGTGEIPKAEEPVVTPVPTVAPTATPVPTATVAPTVEPTKAATPTEAPKATVTPDAGEDVPTDSKGGINGGVIAGIAVGVVVIAVAAVVLVMKKKKK